MLKIPFLSLAFLLGITTYCLADAKTLAEIEPGIWRGSQPSNKELRELKARGISTIIDLRDEGRAVGKEAIRVKALGMKYFNIPMKRTKNIDQRTAAKFLAVIKEPSNQPVFVHCRSGADRTGAMLALYRIDAKGWTYQQAYDEMIKYGFHPHFRKLRNSVLRFKTLAEGTN